MPMPTKQSPHRADTSSGRERSQQQAPLQHDTIRRVVDALPGAIAIVAVRDRLVHANSALAHALERAAEGDRLLEEILDFGGELDGLTDPGRPASPGDGERVVEREVSFLEGIYRLRGSAVALTPRGGEPMLLVSVDAPAAPSASDELCGFGFTRSEMRVASLLADGRSNKGVAAALCISPHTARRHTERVLAKLGVRSRAEVGPKLRGARSARDEG